MSTICGIVHFDGRAVEVAQVQAMLKAVADRSPDGSHYWVQNNLAFGFGALHTTVESSLTRQPLEDGEKSLCISFAGRIDNRGELSHLLGEPGHDRRESSDAELILSSYSMWGEDCLDRILGVFSFALWDERQRRLFCARDLVGTRPFYYYQTSKSFYFASEIRQLLALPEIPRIPNEGMIAEYLVSRMLSKNETQYQGIMRLPPASLLTLEEGQLESREYWDPSAVTPVQYRRDDEYSEHLRELLYVAVGTRLRSQHPVGIQLSGGVDSSSVVAVAADLQRKEMTNGQSLSALSLVFPGWDCDESEFIGAVEAETGVKTHRVPPESVDRLYYSAQVGRYLDYPDYPNGTMSDPLERLARRRGIRVVLTGLGGDEWFQRTDLYLADLLRKGRVISAVRWARSLPEGSLFPFRQSPWFVDGISPLVPGGIKDLLRGGRSGGKSPAWLNPDFARRASLQDRLRHSLNRHRFGDLARAGGFHAATQGFQTHAIEMEERSAASFHIELRYPFHDRRIVEFGLGLPADQRWRNGLHKHVLRQAVGDLLPGSVRRRYTKADFSRVFVEALLNLGRDSSRDLAIADAGWVDGRVVLEMFDEMEKRFRDVGSCQGPEIWPLWSVFGTELLCREVFNRNGSGH